MKVNRTSSLTNLFDHWPMKPFSVYLQLANLNCDTAHPSQDVKTELPPAWSSSKVDGCPTLYSQPPAAGCMVGQIGYRYSICEELTQREIVPYPLHSQFFFFFFFLFYSRLRQAEAMGRQAGVKTDRTHHVATCGCIVCSPSSENTLLFTNMRISYFVPILGKLTLIRRI